MSMPTLQCVYCNGEVLASPALAPGQMDEALAAHWKICPDAPEHAKTFVPRVAKPVSDEARIATLDYRIVELQEQRDAAAKRLAMLDEALDATKSARAAIDQKS